MRKTDADYARELKEKFKKEKEYYAAKRKEKTYKGEYYTINSIFGNDWAIFYALLGGREAGKSYAAMRWAVNRKIKLGDKLKFYWFRLTDAAVKNLLSGGADKLIDPDIKRKYNIKCCTKNTTVFTYDEEVRTDKNGKEIIEKKNLKPFCEVLSCSTFYNTKGIGYFDNEFDGEYIIILDEMNRENSEKNNFDIVYNFVNLLENVARSTKTKIKVVMIGNTLDEASDILTAFNFIPDDFGRYKLKSKRAVIDYIRPNEEYMKRRKGTMADILMPDASTFTNEVQLDRSLLVNKRLANSPSYIIKFSKEKGNWFTVWNGNIIKAYNGEVKPAIAMRRYLDTQFNADLQKNIFDQFDARYYKFTNMSTFKRFQKELKLIKKK